MRRPMMLQPGMGSIIPVAPAEFITVDPRRPFKPRYGNIVRAITTHRRGKTWKPEGMTGGC
jgi:hypothetical protein